MQHTIYENKLRNFNLEQVKQLNKMIWMNDVDAKYSELV